jgi:hypothetical protein
MVVAEKEMSVYDLLSYVQKELKAPKSQYNAFAKYNYRNCEDILEAVKKILPVGSSVILSDNIEMIGDRFYVCASARLMMGSDSIEVQAYAREPVMKKGSDESQITGAASSYARKYALNGLFAIDDSKDADTKDNREQVQQSPKALILDALKRTIADKKITQETVNKWKEFFKIEHFNQLSEDKIKDLIAKINEKV